MIYYVLKFMKTVFIFSMFCFFINTISFLSWFILVFLSFFFNYKFMLNYIGWDLFLIDRFNMLFFFLLVILAIFFFYINFNSDRVFLIMRWVFYMIIIIFLFSRNLLRIFIFFEGILVPIIMMIMEDRYQFERLTASLYLLIYMIFFTYPGVYLLISCKSGYRFNLMKMFNLINFYRYLFIRLIFLMKIAVYLLHYWLIKVHVEVSIKLSILLSSVILKVGGFGLGRFVLNLSLYNQFNYFFIYLGIRGSLIFRFLSFNLIDIKVLVAISSVIYINLSIVLFFLGFRLSKNGFLIIIYHHRFSSLAIFFIAGVIYEFSGRRLFFFKVGSVNWIYGLMFILMLISLNLPFILGFMREVSIFLSLMKVRFWLFRLICVCFFFILFYNLWIFWGSIGFVLMFKYINYFMSLKTLFFIFLVLIKISLIILLIVIFVYLYNLI